MEKAKLEKSGGSIDRAGPCADERMVPRRYALWAEVDTAVKLWKGSTLRRPEDLARQNRPGRGERGK